jgi:mannose-6-phosphate isomerase-like protein (cupin superfamily)
MLRDLTGPRSVYRPPDGGIPAPADYPDAPVSRVLDASTPGAELFAVLVAIGGDIPLHHHPVMELQFVLAGHGLALDADGGETPIAPGGVVISPAGPAGAHGFRNMGSLPLQLLCVYPAPGGATPGRTPFELGTSFVPGPRTTYTPPQLARPAPADYPDAPVARHLDSTDPGAELFAVEVAIGGDIPLHFHPVMELQFVLAGHGLALDADGGETPIAPGGTVLSPAGPAGAHGFRNLGSLPLTLLCVYPAPGGTAPGRTPFERPA